MRDVFLHSCCAGCAVGALQRLEEEGIAAERIALFFSNSNIYPRREYEKRFFDVVNISKKFNIPLFYSSYNHYNWLRKTCLLFPEREGGRRCNVCFYLRLKETAVLAAKYGFLYFTTTLSISPHKNFAKIGKMCKNFEKIFNVKFLEIDFKKKDGFKKSCMLSRKYNFYRQNYCGCEYSIRDKC